MLQWKRSRGKLWGLVRWEPDLVLGEHPVEWKEERALGSHWVAIGRGCGAGHHAEAYGCGRWWGA